MPRYFLKLSYNGSAYHGWQMQKNSANTIQQVMQDNLSMILREEVKLTGCGRTDTGVHARNYVAHFNSSNEDLVLQKEMWINKFNMVLPVDIAVHDILPVIYNAHARYHATERQYHYFISRSKDPFRNSLIWKIYWELDYELMNQAALVLMEYKDFSSFTKSGTQNKNNLCTLTRAVWQQCGEEEWRFTIRANRFLRGMVRAIVGTLVLVGRNRLSLQEFRDVIEAKNRACAGNNAPAQALFLNGIRYPKNIYL